MLLLALLYILAFLMEMWTVCFSESYRGTRGGQGKAGGNCCLPAQVDGQVGGRFFPQVPALCGGWWPPASVRPVQHGSGKGAQLLSFQKIGSQPGKVNFLCLKQRDYLSVWSFFLAVPTPQSNFLLISFLPYEPHQELPERHGFYIARPQGRDLPGFRVCPVELAFLSPILCLSPPMCLWVSLRIPQFVFGGIFPTGPEFSLLLCCQPPREI